MMLVASPEFVWASGRCGVGHDADSQHSHELRHIICRYATLSICHFKGSSCSISEMVQGVIHQQHQAVNLFLAEFVFWLYMLYTSFIFIILQSKQGRQPPAAAFGTTAATTVQMDKAEDKSYSSEG